MRETIEMEMWIDTEAAEHSRKPFGHRLNVARAIIREYVYAHLLVELCRVCLSEIDEKITNRSGYGVEMLDPFFARRARRIT